MLFELSESLVTSTRELTPGPHGAEAATGGNPAGLRRAHPPDSSLRLGCRFDGRLRLLQLDPPLGDLVRPAPSVVELHEPFDGLGQLTEAVGREPVFPLLHPLVASEQKQFRLGVLLLT